MDHVAILSKSKIKDGDNMLECIINKKKTVESRWYIKRSAPFNKINAGDNIYFKESGGPVKAKALVIDVIQFENLNLHTAKTIIKKHGRCIAPYTSYSEFIEWYKLNPKNYCILIFFDRVIETQPFNIDKSGFGLSSAWIYIDDIAKIRK